MGEYRGGLIVDLDSEADDATVGALLDLLKRHDGAVTVEGGRLTIAFSFEASDLPGFASGLVAAIPRVVGISRALLSKADLIGKCEVTGFSVEAIPGDEETGGSDSTP